MPNDFAAQVSNLLKAEASTKTSGAPIDNHFRDVTKMVRVASMAKDS